MAVQRGRDSRHRIPALALVADFREHTLLAGVALDVLAVRAEAESEPDIPDTLTVRALVPQRVPGALPNRLPLRVMTITTVAAIFITSLRPGHLIGQR